MFKLKVKEVLLNKGIKHPAAWLRKEIHVGPNVAQKIASGKAHYIALNTLWKICSRLHTTPDDLIAYIPAPGEVIEESHPVQRLKPKPSRGLVAELETITPEQLRKLEAFARELKQQG